MTDTEQPIIPFTHLHTHSPEGSLLDGFMRIDKAIELIKSWGMDSLGISDHGTMAAHGKFYHACKDAGIHPVLGMEAYITPNKTFKKADFESVDFIQDASEKYIYTFISQEERVTSDKTWTVVEELKPKKLATSMLNDAKSLFLISEIEKTLMEGQKLPDKKAALTRMMNAYIKTQRESGKELCVEANSERRDYYSWFPRIGHLLLMAKNNQGYQNLLELNAIGQLEGFYGKPRIDFEDIKRLGSGIIATTACLGSITSQLIRDGRLTEAKAEIMRLVEAFDEVYLEIQPSRQPEQWVVNNQLIAWSKELGLPLLATSDAHMVSHDEMFIHEALTNIGKGGASDTSDKDSDISVYDSAYLMHPQMMLENGIPPEAIQNAYELSHKCQVDFLEDTETKFPEYQVPKGFTFDSYLAELAHKGLFDLFMRKTYIEDIQLYQKRLDYELEIIAMKNLSAYFVIVWDYVNAARKKGIYVGPGRGSGCGSLVLFALKVTNLDPIKYDLLFERMLNPERPGFPDIDVDFDFFRKSEVLDYLKEKYGDSNVAQIGTYTTLSSKIVLKDVGRILDIDHNEINNFNKELPSSNGKVMDLADAVEEVPAIVAARKKYPKLFELALEVQSMPRGAGVHPCGVLVGNAPLQEVVPLMRSKEEHAVTQYEGGPLEDLGYIKFDILSLKNLSVMRIAVDLIKERHGVDIDINNIEPDNKEVFSMIQKGNTQGQFQLESPGMTQVFTGLTTVDFNSLMAGVALYRPGPMAFIPNYQARANGLEEVKYTTPEFEEFSADTFGILVYQEQVMKLVQAMAGYTPGEADSFRKAIGKLFAV